MNSLSIQKKISTKKSEKLFFADFKSIEEMKVKNQIHKPSNIEDLCENLSQNIFKLEEDLAYFNFAVQEVQDITKNSTI